MNQKQMLFKFLESKEEPQTLDNIMEFIEKSDKPIPRSTIRARLSEMRKRGIKINDELRQVVRNGEGWTVKDA